MAVTTREHGALLRMSEALGELGISRSHMYQLLTRGDVRAHKLGARTVFTAEDMKLARRVVEGELQEWRPGDQR